MAAEHEGNEPASQPDWALVTNGRMPDGGPRYTETPVDPSAPGAFPVAEPWNAVTASFFIVIVAVWVWRLRGRYGQYPFLCCCLPILLAGGVGGTFYHALRTSRAYFLLDVIPISVLGLAGAVFMAIRYWGGRGWWFIPAVAVFYVGVNRLLFAAVGPTNIQLSVNLSYASLALVVLTPIVLVQLRSRFRHGQWVVAGLISFVIAWFFRLWDQQAGPYMPMGSHWLWHTFGAIATALVIEYFYLVEGEKTEPPEAEPGPAG
ncbi:MAG: hypothetical protein JWO38_2813 [Gemmataceae bacterium]|nr:hypothetical protein [Gemmataceae bacterium]